MLSPSSHGYGPVAGSPELQAALRAKLAAENGMTGVDVMVTQGANQAFMNLAIGLLDPGDACVLFAPYYFNHLMALQMTNLAPSLRIGKHPGDSMAGGRCGWLTHAHRAVRRRHAPGPCVAL